MNKNLFRNWCWRWLKTSSSKPFVKDFFSSLDKESSIIFFVSPSFTRSQVTSFILFSRNCSWSILITCSFISSWYWSLTTWFSNFSKDSSISLVFWLSFVIGFLLYPLSCSLELARLHLLVFMLACIYVTLTYLYANFRVMCTTDHAPKNVFLQWSCNNIDLELQNGECGAQLKMHPIINSTWLDLKKDK